MPMPTYNLGVLISVTETQRPGGIAAIRLQPWAGDIFDGTWLKVVLTERAMNLDIAVFLNISAGNRNMRCGQPGRCCVRLQYYPSQIRPGNKQ